MAVATNTYGSVDEVAALTVMYTDDGVYDLETRPTLGQVETFLDRVSAILNMVLAREGFSVPVTQADAALALDDFAVEHAAYLCHSVNRAGPYVPGNEQLRGRTAFEVIREAAASFIQEWAGGLEALGATRTRAGTYGLGCRTQDADGDELTPFFQRKMMGNEVVDWEDYDEDEE